MRILVIGGMHGNEPLGISLVLSLKNSPIQGVDSLMANPRAVSQGTRFIESDLNRSFGEQSNNTLESRRARYLAEKTRNYDIVLDFHNTETPGNNCCFVGLGCDEALYGVAKQLGFLRCVEATYDCINKYCLNTISIEVSIGDQLDSVAIWRKAIEQLAKAYRTEDNVKLSVYRYQKRVTWDEREELKLSTWEPFKELTSSDKTLLGVEGEIMPIFIGSHLTEYYATLIKKTGEK